jgi:kinesin family protein 5
MKVFVKISYLEIYNETIIDLLNTSRDNLDVRETKSKMIVIPGLKELDVKDYDSAIKL